MNRRSLLSSTAAGLGALLAGCSRTGTNASGNPTTTETTTDTSFRVVDSYCRSEAGGATVDFGEGEVTVQGRIEAPNGCYTAELAGASLEGETLTVRVRTVDTSGVCVQCLYAIEYEATVGVSGDGPETVVVVHDGERVASVER